MQLVAYFFWPKKNGLAVYHLSSLIPIENNNPGILHSRGNNILFKNVEIFEIHKKFVKVGWFNFDSLFHNLGFFIIIAKIQDSLPDGDDDDVDAGAAADQKSQIIR